MKEYNTFTVKEKRCLGGYCPPFWLATVTHDRSGESIESRNLNKDCNRIEAMKHELLERLGQNA